MQQPARQPVQPDVQRAVQPVREPGAQQYLPHEQEQRNGDEDEIGGRPPQCLPGEGPPGTVREGQPDEDAEQPQHRGDVDPGAEEDEEGAGQRQYLHHRHRLPAGRGGEHRGREQDQQEDDGNHRPRAISTASSASAVSSSNVRELSSRSSSSGWPSSSDSTLSTPSTRIIAQKARMPKAQMPCGITSGTRSAELSCASNSRLSSTSDQAAQAQKAAK